MPALRWLVILGAIGAAAYFVSFRFWVAARICASDPDSLTQYHGDYIDEVFLTTLKDTKSVPTAMKAWSLGPARPVAVSITKDGIAAAENWHDGAITVDCAYALRKEVSLEGRSERYVRLDDRNDGAFRMAPYFNVLFSGCYRDQKNEPWCFRPNEIQIGQTTHHGELQMDLVALPQENVVQLNQGDSLLVFRRTSGGGWTVNESEKASAQKELDWIQPWRVLTPAPASN